MFYLTNHLFWERNERIAQKQRFFCKKNTYIFPILLLFYTLVVCIIELRQEKNKFEFPDKPIFTKLVRNRLLPPDFSNVWNNDYKVFYENRDSLRLKTFDTL